MTTPSLFADLQQEKPKPHKRVRETSVQAYEQGRESFKGRKGDVLRWLAAFFNKYNFSPTSAELVSWHYGITTDNADWMTLLLYVRRGLSDLQRATKRTQAVVERVPGGDRPCRVSSREEHSVICSTWRIIERGTR